MPWPTPALQQLITIVHQSQRPSQPFYILCRAAGTVGLTVNADQPVLSVAVAANPRDGRKRQHSHNGRPTPLHRVPGERGDGAGLRLVQPAASAHRSRSPHATCSWLRALPA